MKNKILLVVSLLIIFSCKKETENLKQVNLSVQENILLDNSFDYREIINIDAKNIFFNIRGDCFYISIDKKSYNKYKKIIKKGKGPDEYLFLTFVNNSCNKFISYDVYGKEIIEKKNNKIIKLFKLEDDKNHLLHLIKIDNDTYIATGLIHGGRFGVYDSNGNLLKVVGYYPINDSSTVEAYFFGSIVQSELKSKPDNSSIIACASFSSELLEIFKYNKKNKDINRVNKIDLTKSTVYKNTDDNMKYIIPRSSILGYLSFSVTNNYIYILFNKYTGEDSMKDQSKIFCNEVRVFDWKGELVKKYFLEKGAKSIYVYNDELYALGMDENYNSQIYVYKIDEDE